MRPRLLGVFFGLAALFLVVAAPGEAPAADKDTLVIALDTLGAQIMDPIMDTRAPHAHYHAPSWASPVGLALERAGMGRAWAERGDRPGAGRGGPSISA